MSTPSVKIAPALQPQMGLRWRLAVVAAVLTVETLLLSYLVQKTPLDSLTGSAWMLREVQHWLFRFIIVYFVSLTMLAYLRDAGRELASALDQADTPWRGAWLIVHLVVMLPFAALTDALYGGWLPLPFALTAIAWHLCGLAAAGSLLAGAAPAALWRKLLRATGVLPLYALAAAAAAVFAIQASQLLWEPTAELTFELVRLTLAPFISDLHSSAPLTLTTPRFEVLVSEKCSGLEGVGLMLVFCTTWLAYFKQEYRFPRSLVILPIAVVLVFVLNVLRIAALVMIGNAGYPGIAAVGFHSQAGWIAFNLVAFGVAVLAKHSAWMHRVPQTPISCAPAPAAAAAAAAAANMTAAYLIPLLAILTAGMIAHALSAGFEFLYPLRLTAALGALWIYRHSYRDVDWRCSWQGPAVGVAVAVVWWGFAYVLLAPGRTPVALQALPDPLRGAWLAVRVFAGAVTVPIAEELAFRGYLMRRLVAADFQTVAYARVRWPAVAVTAIAFGATHGVLWCPAILAGLAYGAVAMQTGRLGDAVAAHGTTNALLAVLVLRFDQWQFW